MMQMTKESIKLPLSAPADHLLQEAYALDRLIKIATEQITKLQERKEMIIAELLTHDIRDAGNYAIEDKIRTVRKVNVKRFSAMFPDEYARLISDEIRRAKMNAGKLIRVQDAERMLGKDQLDPVCDLQSTVIHVVVKKQNDGTEEGA